MNTWLVKSRYRCRDQVSTLKQLTLVVLCTVGIMFSSGNVYGSQPPTVNSMVLKVMTFNVRHGTDLQGNVSIEKQVEFIKQHDIDLLALQEIDQATKRSDKVNQAEFFADGLSLNHYFQPFMPYDGGEYGITALSKMPILASQPLTLPDGLEPRVFPQLLLEVDEQPLLFIPIHFDWPLDESARIAQAKALLVRLDNKLPIVLAGDFNDYPDSRTLALFKEAGFTFTVNNTSTFLGADDSGKEQVEIDFIAVRNGEKTKLSILESFVLNQQTLSDHAPVITSILITKKI